MANNNINPVDLDDVNFLVDGERANAATFNRPLVEISDNQIAQKAVLDEVDSVLSSNDPNLDTLQKVVDKLGPIEENSNNYILPEDVVKEEDFFDTRYVNSDIGDDDLNDGLSTDTPWKTIAKAVDDMLVGTKRIIFLAHTGVDYIIDSPIKLRGKNVVLRSGSLSSAIEEQPSESEIINIVSKHYETDNNRKAIFGFFKSGINSSSISIFGYIKLTTGDIDPSILNENSESATGILSFSSMFNSVFGKLNVLIDHFTYYEANITAGGPLEGTNLSMISVGDFSFAASYLGLSHLTLINRGSNIEVRKPGSAYCKCSGTASLSWTLVEHDPLLNDKDFFSGLQYKGTSDQPVNVTYAGMDLTQ